ncbi:hypothetical protein BGZ73_008549 [Actinomortierella ambigua]|nr:hypothetical protein BGZ73_008549 [Actinomortierella ambigua]
MGGATCLLHWRDASGQQSLTLLADRLSKHFNATPIGRWSIHWKVYRDTSPVSKSGTGKMMHLVNVQGGTTIRGSSPTVLPSGPGGASGAGATAAGGPGGPGGPGSTAASSTGAGGPGMGMGPIAPPSAVAGGAAAAVAAAAAMAAGGAALGGLSTSGNNSVDPTQIATWCMIDEGALGGPASASGSADPQQQQQRKAVIVEVEKDMENLVAKLKSLWVLRQHAQVEGYVFDVGDFIVRAGNIMVASTSYKGLLIEFEYLPQMSSINACKPILEEFVQLLLPPGVNLYTPQMLDYPYEQVGLDPNGWSSLHSRFQYSVLFRRQHIL